MQTVNDALGHKVDAAWACWHGTSSKWPPLPAWN